MGNTNCERLQKWLKVISTPLPCPWIIPSHMVWLCDSFWPAAFKYDAIRDLGIRTYSLLLFLKNPVATSIWISLGKPVDSTWASYFHSSKCSLQTNTSEVILDTPDSRWPVIWVQWEHPGEPNTRIWPAEPSLYCWPAVLWVNQWLLF